MQRLLHCNAVNKVASQLLQKLLYPQISGQKYTMNIIPIPALRDNYIWLLINKLKTHAIIVDPGLAAPVIEKFRTINLKPSAILVTHHHSDHSGGVPELVHHYQIPAYGPAKEITAGITNPVQEKDLIFIPEFGQTFSVIDIPGHTRGHIAYYTNGIVFCGDTLFTAGCGRLFEGTAEQMVNSLTKLVSLPEKALIYCGHEYTAENLRFAHSVEPNNEDINKRRVEVHQLRDQGLPTVPAPLFLEKKTNPFLRCEAPEVIKSAESYCGTPLKTKVEVFSVLRAWKNNF